jgi:hypothetical protein
LFNDAPVADALAVAEGLQAHRENLHVRLQQDAPSGAPVEDGSSGALEEQ